MKHISTPLPSSFLTLETTGLSAHRDNIFLIGVAEEAEENFSIYFCDRLEDETKILSQFVEEHNHKCFFTWEGRDFISRFFQEKCQFYGIPHDISFCNLSRTARDYAFLFPLSSLSKSSLEQFFHLPPTARGEDFAKGYAAYFQGDMAKETLIHWAKEKLSSLISLSKHLQDFYQQETTFVLGERRLTLTSLHRDKHCALLCGEITPGEDCFFSSSRFTLLIEDTAFRLEIPMKEAPYDHRMCYYLLRSDYPSVQCLSQIPAPHAIIILYLDHWLYPHVKCVVQSILQEQ